LDTEAVNLLRAEQEKIEGGWVVVDRVTLPDGSSSRDMARISPDGILTVITKQFTGLGGQDGDYGTLSKVSVSPDGQVAQSTRYVQVEDRTDPNHPGFYTESLRYFAGDGGKKVYFKGGELPEFIRAAAVGTVRQEVQRVVSKVQNWHKTQTPVGN